MCVSLWYYLGSAVQVKLSNYLCLLVRDSATGLTQNFGSNPQHSLQKANAICVLNADYPTTGKTFIKTSMLKIKCAFMYALIVN